MIVNRIMPGMLPGSASPEWITSINLVIFLGFFVVLWRVVVEWLPKVGIILITFISTGRRRGPARITRGPEGDGTARVAVPEPGSRAGDRPGVPGRGVLRRPGHGAGQVRDGAPCHGGRRAGHRRGGGVRVLPAVVLPGSRGASRVRAGRTGAGQARAPRRPQAHRADPRLGRGAAGSRSRPEAGRPGRAHRRAVRRARAPPLHRARAGPLQGALQKPLTHHPPNAGRRKTRPRPCDLHLAPRLLNRMPTRMPARSPLPAAGWTPATSSCVMLPCTRARPRSRLGLGVLTGK